jgi:hypothetical protein
MRKLSEEEVARFHEQGYLVVPQVLEESDLADVRTEYGQLLAQRVPQWQAEGRCAAEVELPADEGFAEQLLHLALTPGFDPGTLAEVDLTLPHMPFTVPQRGTRFHIGSAVVGLMANPRLTSLLESLLGPALLASPNQHCRLKLPVPDDVSGFGARVGETLYAPTMWHQDYMTQMPSSADTPLVTCWVPMSDVDEEKGCLVVVPGAHRDPELLPWPMPSEVSLDLDRRGVPLPVRKGDVILLHKRIPHSAMPNRSGEVRWSFDFRYHPVGSTSDRPWFPSLQLTGPGATGKPDAARWRQMWEAALDELVDSGEVMPGRREFAQLVAESMISRWEKGEHPRFVPALETA